MDGGGFTWRRWRLCTSEELVTIPPSCAASKEGRSPSARSVDGELSNLRSGEGGESAESIWDVHR